MEIEIGVGEENGSLPLDLELRLREIVVEASTSKISVTPFSFFLLCVFKSRTVLYSRKRFQTTTFMVRHVIRVRFKECVMFTGRVPEMDCQIQI